MRQVIPFLLRSPPFFYGSLVHSLTHIISPNGVAGPLICDKKLMMKGLERERGIKSDRAWASVHSFKNLQQKTKEKDNERNGGRGGQEFMCVSKWQMWTEDPVTGTGPLVEHAQRFLGYSANCKWGFEYCRIRHIMSVVGRTTMRQNAQGTRGG